MDWGALRSELGIMEPFSADEMAEAQYAALHVVAVGTDFSDVPFWTLDPSSSLDLDQAMFLERSADGFVVRYAIADVAAFVKPSGTLDAASRVRGETFYCPDLRVPLYPAILSEGAASLLPDELRPTLLWTIELDATGEFVGARVDRAMVKSHAKRDYQSVQSEVDAGSLTEQVELLRTIGRLRIARGRERDAVDLRTPQQLVTNSPDGQPVLAYRADVEVESWNEQISLLTGIAAGRIMLGGGVGLLRTLPPPDSHLLVSLRQSALALHLDWPDAVSYGEFVSALNPREPAQAAMLNLSARLLRGAGYVPFVGERPVHPSHYAVAAPYAHCTAPLRRLVDRFAGEICVAHSAGRPVPQWVLDALPSLPATMAAADRRSHALERATIDLAEATVLQPHIGQVFDAVVVDVDEKGAMVQLTDPPVRSRCLGSSMQLGSAVRVRLVESDPVGRFVRFEAEQT